MEQEPIIEEQLYPDEKLISQSTVCEHYMILEDPTTAVCNKHCGHGCSFDPETQSIFNGIIVDNT